MQTLLTDKGFFESLAARLCVPVAGADRVALYLTAEASDFIRFNRATVRQATHVSQGYATLAVVNGLRRIESTLSLTGHVDLDGAALESERSALLAQLADVPEDPYLLLPQSVDASSRHETGVLPEPEALVEAVTSAASMPAGRWCAPSPTAAASGTGTTSRAFTSTGASTTRATRRSRPRTPARSGTRPSSRAASPPAPSAWRCSDCRPAPCCPVRTAPT
jgi:hypothetical protein